MCKECREGGGVVSKGGRGGKPAGGKQSGRSISEGRGGGARRWRGFCLVSKGGGAGAHRREDQTGISVRRRARHNQESASCVCLDQSRRDGRGSAGKRAASFARTGPDG